MMQTLRAFFDRLVSLINANSLTGALILMVGFIARPRRSVVILPASLRAADDCA